MSLVVELRTLTAFEIHAVWGIQLPHRQNSIAQRGVAVVLRVAGTYHRININYMGTEGDYDEPSTHHFSDACDRLSVDV